MHRLCFEGHAKSSGEASGHVLLPQPLHYTKTCRACAGSCACSEMFNGRSTVPEASPVSFARKAVVSVAVCQGLQVFCCCQGFVFLLGFEGFLSLSGLCFFVVASARSHERGPHPLKKSYLRPRWTGRARARVGTCPCLLLTVWKKRESDGP